MIQIFQRIVAVLFLSICLVNTVSANTAQGTKTPLIGITAVTDEESSVVEPEAAPGGALEMSRFFATHLVANLVKCGNSVESVFGDWLKTHGLIPLKKTTMPDRYFMRVWDHDKRGVFEGRYQINNKTQSIRVSLDFYDISGKKLVIQDVNKVLSTYKLADLWESLAEAIECDPS